MTYNLQLTPSFSLKEMLEGTALPREAIVMNYQDFEEWMVKELKQVAIIIQIMRDATEEKFGDRFRGFVVTAGLRVLRWEKAQKRSGNGQHPKATAADIQPICDDEDYMEIFNWIFRTFHKNFEGGFAKKEPNLAKGKKGFIHVDNRGKKARWNY